MELRVRTFRADCTDKEAAMKVLEEASEAREAWAAFDAVRESPNPLVAVAEAMCYRDLADELADCITACCNLADRHGIDMQAALDRVERKNRERGRYDDG